MEHVLIIVTVPVTHADEVREALGRAGAARIGNYTHCSFSVRGIGRFKPSEGAKPFIGEEGALEEVEEERIETLCPRDRVDEVLAAVKKAHPYEEPVTFILPMLSY